MNTQNRSPIATSIPIVSALVAGAALGAAGQFLLDAQNGRRRRALLRDQTKRLTRKALSRADQLARHTANQVEDAITQVQSVAPLATLVAGMESELSSSSENLIHAVRAGFNGVVTDPQAIDVFCTEGRIILKGSVFRDEVQSLLDSVQSVPGVNGIENQLTEVDNVD
jgi:osmotically-inducible protein OsmY